MLFPRGNLLQWSKQEQLSADRLRYAPGNEKFQFNNNEIYFTGEMVYQSMFNDYIQLRQFKPLAYALHEKEEWNALYDTGRLQN